MSDGVSPAQHEFMNNRSTILTYTASIKGLKWMSSILTYRKRLIKSIMRTYFSVTYPYTIIASKHICRFADFIFHPV